MGLDITFHEKIERVGPHPTSWIDQDGRERSCYDDLDHERVYLWALHEDPGTFTFTQRGLDEEFHYVSVGRTASWSAPYGSYGRFRAALLGLSRPDLVNDQDGRTDYAKFWELPEGEAHAIPFAEMVDFGDNEGDFTGEVAAELLKDFRAYRDHIDQLGIRHQHQYLEYMAGLEIVTIEGLVSYA